MTEATAAPANRLYVGNLPYSATNEQLAALFAEAGTVTNVVVMFDKFTGRSKGFAFVDMETAEAAQTAIDRFNGYELDGRALVVNVARPRAPREPGSFHGGDRGGDRRGGFGGGRGGDRGGDRGGYRSNSR